MFKIRLMTENLRDITSIEDDAQIIEVPIEAAISTNGLAKAIGSAAGAPEIIQYHRTSYQLYIPGQAPIPHESIVL